MVFEEKAFCGLQLCFIHLHHWAPESPLYCLVRETMKRVGNQFANRSRALVPLWSNLYETQLCRDASVDPTHPPNLRSGQTGLQCNSNQSVENKPLKGFSGFNVFWSFFKGGYGEDQSQTYLRLRHLLHSVDPLWISTNGNLLSCWPSLQRQQLCLPSSQCSILYNSGRGHTHNQS